MKRIHGSVPSRGRVNARTLRIVQTTLCYLITALSGACRKGDDGTQIIPLEGKVEKISATSDTTGEITVRYLDKRQEEVQGKGEITAETEIMINGAVAKLKDIREGERVRGEVRVEKKGGVRKLIVLRIQVDRAVPVGGGG